MIYICLAHNMIEEGDGWKNSSEEDVTEQVRKMKKPVCITSCPSCNDQDILKQHFLTGSPLKSKLSNKNKSLEDIEFDFVGCA